MLVEVIITDSVNCGLCLCPVDCVEVELVELSFSFQKKFETNSDSELELSRKFRYSIDKIGPPKDLPQISRSTIP